MWKAFTIRTRVKKNYLLECDKLLEHYFEYEYSVQYIRYRIFGTVQDYFMDNFSWYKYVSRWLTGHLGVADDRCVVIIATDGFWHVTTVTLVTAFGRISNVTVSAGSSKADLTVEHQALVLTAKTAGVPLYK